MSINYFNKAGKFKLIQSGNVLFKTTGYYRVKLGATE